MYVVQSEYQQLVDFLSPAKPGYHFELSKRGAYQVIQAQSPFESVLRVNVLVYIDPKHTDLPLDVTEIDDKSWTFIWIEELSSVKKKIIGGIFQELDLRGLYDNPFPLTQASYARIGEESVDFTEDNEKEQHKIWKSLKYEMNTWYSLSNYDYNRLFWNNPYLPSILQRNKLWPYAKPFFDASTRRYSKQPWDLFAHWVHGSSTVWKERYKEGVVLRTYKDKEYLFFNPSHNAANKWQELVNRGCYFNDFTESR